MNTKIRIVLFSFLAVAGMATVFATTSFSEDVVKEEVNKVETVATDADNDKADCGACPDAKCKAFCEANPDATKAECQAFCESTCEKECSPAEKQKCQSTCSKSN